MELEGLLDAAMAAPAPRLRALLGGAPSTSSTSLLSIAEDVSSAADPESLARPLLETLQDLMGPASTYVTVVHPDADEQQIRDSRNAGRG